MLRRRRMLRRLTAVALVLCVAAAGIYLTMTMLFKISAIEVRNAEGELLQQAGAYSSEEVLQVLGLQLEENIFSFSAEEKEAILEQQLPLLEQIDVIRRYPGTVEVRVTPAVPTYAIQTSAGWLTISANLKVISSGAEQPDLPVLYGGEPASTQPGVQLYTGNFLQDCTVPGKGGAQYEKYSGFALETQHYPCSPSHPEFPSTVLRAGKVFRVSNTLRFFTGKQCGVI